MAIKIMLDAGHYGKRNWSPCKTTPKYYESLMTWDLTNYLKAELEKYGFEVGTTRADQKKDLGVVARGQKAKGYDLFLSIHSNATGNGAAVESVDRPVIIYPVNNDTAKAFAALLGACVKDTMQTKNNYKTYSKFYPNSKDKDYYGVIRGAVTAGCKMALIIEHSFHTCTRSTEWLLKDENLKKMAVNEAAVIAKYYGYDKKDDADTDNSTDTNTDTDNSTDTNTDTDNSTDTNTDTDKGGTFTMDMKVLRRGDKGEQVKAMQMLLEGRGYTVGGYGFDGSFGPATQQAVWAFQSDKGLSVDGICGPATWGSLING